MKPMDRFFNTEGPIIPDDHYYIPFYDRVDWEEIQHLIARKRYFLLHAPRQTGKTTALLEMMKALNARNDYTTLYVNIEAAQVTRNDVARGMRVVCEAIASRAEIYDIEPCLMDMVKKLVHEQQGEGMLTRLLSDWARISEKPVVLFIDEADALIGDTLVSLLRQIRAGYDQRPGAFPQSIVLCGVRDIKDYRIHLSSGDIITGGSAFNIKADSLRMGNFDETEVRSLLQQHTDQTGQIFEDEIFGHMWEDSRGQPWLVNALAHTMTWKNHFFRDRNIPITLNGYLSAREQLISSRATHLDQLTDKLSEPRVYNVLSALISSEERTDIDSMQSHEISPDDQRYVEDLGLITTHPQIAISNRIYQEVIPRELTWVTQTRIVHQQDWYLTSENRIDIKKLLAAFQQFFRENAESWIERFQYKEAGPQLLMQAFLQRIINGGGRIHREYGLGRGRTDLLIEWPVDKTYGYHGNIQRIVIELKIQRGALEKLLSAALEQISRYSDQCRADEAHLVIFNRDPEVKWDKKIWHKDSVFKGRKIDIWGC